ncbi:MAG: hypothetical protein ACK4NC_03790 [Candidatus Gracilibacteria bacterium]
MTFFQLRNRNLWIHVLMGAAAAVLATILLHIPHATATGLPIFGESSIDLPKIEGTPGASSESMVTYLVTRVINFIKIILQAIAVGYIIFIGMDMIMNMSNEDMLKKKQNSFLYALYGFIIINIGDLGLSIFNPATSGGDLFSKSAFLGFLNLILNLIKFSMATVSVVLIVLTGFKILSPRSTKIDSEKKHLTAIATGLFVMTIADLVQKVFIPNGYELTPGVTDSSATSAQRGTELILNIGGALLTVMGPIALFFMILAGFYYVTANGQEDRIKKAKNIFIGTIFAVIIAYSAYALVSEVIRNAIFV